MQARQIRELAKALVEGSTIHWEEPHSGGNRMQSTVNLAIHNLTVKSDWCSVSSIARAVIFAAWHAGRHYGQQKGGHAQRHACC